MRTINPGPFWNPDPLINKVWLASIPNTGLGLVEVITGVAGTMTVGSDAVLLAGLESLPPATVAVLTTLAAVFRTFTVNVMDG